MKADSFLIVEGVYERITKFDRFLPQKLGLGAELRDNLLLDFLDLLEVFLDLDGSETGHSLLET